MLNNSVLHPIYQEEIPITNINVGCLYPPQIFALENTAHQLTALVPAPYEGGYGETCVRAGVANS